MSTVEEAASLFGSAEVDSDIFGAAGEGEGHDGEHGASSLPANGEAHANPDVDVLFGGPSANGFLEQDSWPSSDLQHNYDPNYSTPGDSYHQQQSGWDDQRNVYDQSGMQAQEPHYNSQNFSNQSETYQPQAQTSPYAAYNHTSSVETQNTYSSTTVSQTTTSYYQQWGDTSNSYDPYKQEPTQSNNYYSPPAAPVQSTLYDPYKPSDQPRTAPQPPSSYSYSADDRARTVSSMSTYAVPSVPPVAPPAPPEVTIAPYRPKVLNAYDPPLPPPKSKRFPTQNAFQAPNAYSSYALPQPLDPDVSSPPPPQSSSLPYSPGSTNVTLQPPPPRKFQSPGIQHLQNGNIHHNYPPANGDNSHSTMIDNSEYGQQHGATSPRSASRYDSTSASSDLSQPSAKPEATVSEFLEDPEGGSADMSAVDGTPSLESDSGDTLNASWSADTDTTMPLTPRRNDGVSLSTQSAPLHVVEDAGHNKYLPEDQIEVVPASEPAPYDPYRPNGPKTIVPARQNTLPSYGHQVSAPIRTSSPASVNSQHSYHEPRQQPLPKPHVPGNINSAQANDPYSPSNRLRSASDGSVLSSHVAPFAPSNYSREQSNGSSEYGSHTSRYSYPDRPSSTASDSQAVQCLALPVQTYPSYAPSPSLLGTNDPLGRANARVPVLSFGFGGKVVTCFHEASVLNTGFDVALSSRQSRDINIRSLRNIIPQSALEDTTAMFPGPLFSDPGSHMVGLVRSGSSTQTKSKKAKVIKYLEERIEELSSGVAYLSSGQSEYGRVEGKLILVKLLKIMVENDSRLSGSSEIDKLIRATLIPRLTASTDLEVERFSTPADGLGGLAATEASLTVHYLKPSHLDKIQNFLVRGERRQACHYALNERLWAHAMVIASSIDKELWQEVANEFIRTELDFKLEKDGRDRSTEPKHAGSGFPIVSGGLESLRFAYSLYAGQGAAAVQALLPAKPLGEGVRIPPPLPHFVTPMTPSFPLAPNVPPDVLSKWTETVAMLISSPISLDTSSALTALGDQLASNQWIEAAHACYLLSPQTSPLGGIGTPSTRIVLCGSASPHVATTFHRNSDAIVFSEIVEFALSLATPPKGQEPAGCLQHLQPYRLIHAYSLAEMGHTQLAVRYCEAITSSVSRGSPYFNQTFFDHLSELTDRLIAAPSLDKSGSWMGAKMTRPSLDKIGNWLEGRLTKFIAGEGDSPSNGEDHQALAQQLHGPFSHYSSISSAMHSADPSPHGSTTNLASTTGTQPPPARSGSAMAMRSSAGSPQLLVNRSSSAMDYVRPHDRRSPVHRLASIHTSGTGFAQQKSAYGHSNSSTIPVNGTGRNEESDQGSPWWGSDTSDSRTPTSAFMHVPNEVDSASSSGFISLMDSMPVVQASHGTHSNNPPLKEEDEDEEDLGLGNTPKASQEHSQNNDGKSSAPPDKQEASQAKEVAVESESKPATGSSWLSKWWKRESASGPIKANLGEETAFYYDKELKRWVNKKAGAEPPKSAVPPPPPSRSQTASPGRSGSFPSPGPPSPARPASAVDLSSPPRKNTLRVRSNLVPDDSPFPPTPATATFLDSTQPPARPRSGASKRPMRSRYVDVFQQPPTPS